MRQTSSYLTAAAAADLSAPRPALEHVLPLRWAAGADATEITGCLHELSRHVGVTVVGGSEPEVWQQRDRLWPGAVQAFVIPDRRPRPAGARSSSAARQPPSVPHQVRLVGLLSPGRCFRCRRR